MSLHGTNSNICHLRINLPVLVEKLEEFQIIVKCISSNTGHHEVHIHQTGELDKPPESLLVLLIKLNLHDYAVLHHHLHVHVKVLAMNLAL